MLVGQRPSSAYSTALVVTNPRRRASLQGLPRRGRLGPSPHPDALSRTAFANTLGGGAFQALRKGSQSPTRASSPPTRDPAGGLLCPVSQGHRRHSPLLQWALWR